MSDNHAPLPEEEMERQHVDDCPNDTASIPSEENELKGMSETVANAPTYQDPRLLPERDNNDVLVDFLNNLEFSSNIFSELDMANWDAKKFQYYYQTPDLFVVRNAIGILNLYDEPTKERDAFMNLLKWMLVRMSCDPYWMTRLGWLMRFFSSHMNPSSYWPLKYHEAFTPKYWKQDIIMNKSKEELNKEIRDPDSVFNW